MRRIGLVLALLGPAYAADWQDWPAGGLQSRLAVGPEGAGGRPLLIVLHGCAQSNLALQQHSALGEAADRFGAVVALPRVPGGGVLAGCWDYYGAAHSRSGRHSGPLLAFTEALLASPELAIDPARVWIAGLSSGAGQALVTACLAPDVFSGVGLAGGPGLGTEASQIAQVSSVAASTTDLCRRLAGPYVADFVRQRAVVVTGDRDFIVAPGYARVNAEGLAGLYGATQQEALELAELPGAPGGGGRLWLDATGPRVALLEVAGLDHAWPGGAGSGPTREFVAQGGLDLGAFLLAFLAGGEGSPPPIPPTSPDAGVPEPAGADCPSVVATLPEHTRRLAVHDGVYGAADAAYTELLARHGVATPFPLYEGPDGRWYADPTGLDCAAPADAGIVARPEADAGSPFAEPRPDGGSPAEPMADEGAAGCSVGASPRLDWLVVAVLLVRRRRRNPA